RASTYPPGWPPAGQPEGTPSHWQPTGHDAGGTSGRAQAGQPGGTPPRAVRRADLSPVVPLAATVVLLVTDAVLRWV
ncbi:MAG TPA: hypothetical protein VGD67_10260, partial [Pseudonocardiaceae bacterium]